MNYQELQKNKMLVYPAGGEATGGSRYDTTVSGGGGERAGLTCIRELLAVFVCVYRFIVDQSVGVQVGFIPLRINTRHKQEVEEGEASV